MPSLLTGLGKETKFPSGNADYELDWCVSWTESLRMLCRAREPVMVLLTLVVCVCVCVTGLMEEGSYMTNCVCGGHSGWGMIQAGNNQARDIYAGTRGETGGGMFQAGGIDPGEIQAGRYRLRGYKLGRYRPSGVVLVFYCRVTNYHKFCG